MIPQGVILAVGAFAGGYLVGCLPVAWLAVRRARHRRGGVERIDPASPFAIPGLPPRRLGSGRGRPGTMDVLAAGGPRVALVTVALELAKGGVVGLGAHFYNDSPWFVATAIAGCVVGDTFPVGMRMPRRGVVPLLAGLWAGLPGIWVAGLVIAIPALLILAMSGVAFDGVVAITVPLAFLLGTRDVGTLVPAAIIVFAIVGRNRLRRRSRRASTSPPPLPAPRTGP